MSAVRMTNLTRLSLSHNRISVIPPSLADLENLEILNLFNNHIEELPTSLSSLPKLRILNLGWVLWCQYAAPAPVGGYAERRSVVPALGR